MDERTPEEQQKLTDTVHTEHGAEAGEVEADDDVVTDPALDDRLGSDWVDEGGATPAGPATSTH